MKRFFLAGAAMAMALTGVATAQAADAIPPVVETPIYEVPIEEPVAVASGWYLRGDVGYSWNRLEGAAYNTATGPASFTTASVDDGFNFGVGVGYKIRDYLRTDLTLDYSQRVDFTGSTGPGGPCTINAVVFAAPNCVSRDASTYQALSLLANVYVDLATYGRITPYVGAGIGGTYVKWGTLQNTECEAGNPANCNGTSIDHAGYAEWRFTAALMAGASIDLTCNLKADVGYRYRRISGGNMFAYNGAVNSGPGYDATMHSHEVRGGLRYSLGGCETAYIEPAPIYPQPVYK